MLLLDRAGNALAFQWPEHFLTITLDRFRERNGGLHAELTATTTAPGYNPHLLQASINLTALRTRHDFSSRLTTLYPEPPWDALIEEVCARGIRMHREGEPVIRLTGTGEIESPQFVIAPLIYRRHPTVLFGPGGKGKSLLAAIIAMLAMSGGTVAGLFAAEPAEVLCLDFESDECDWRYRAHLVRIGHPELEKAEPLYRRCYLPLADDLSAIQRIIAQSGVKLVIIDSLALAAGGELEKPEMAIKVFSAIRSLSVSSLIIAHPPKNAEEKSIFGSVFFTNLARSIWELKQVQEAGESLSQVGLYHRKINLGPLHRPLGFRITFDDGIRLRAMDLSDEPELAKGLPLKSRLQRALRDRAKTPTELADELGAELAQVRNRLLEGRDDWCIVAGKVGTENRWGLLSKREDAG